MVVERPQVHSGRDLATAAWIQDGVRVWYRPSPGVYYAGTVTGELFQLGEHTWCVKLRDMDPHYRNGKRSTVSAAACDCLKPYDAGAIE